MISRLEYHFSMRRSLPVLLMLAIAVGLVPSVQAQINGTRASVTSLGGSPFFPPGPRASVTSLGPLGFTPSRFPKCCFSFNGQQQHHHHNGFLNGVLPIYSMPFYYGGYPDIVNPVDDSMEQAYGPTSDRERADRVNRTEEQNDERLNRLEQQMDDIESTPAKKTEPSSSEPQTTVADQPDTVLVFRDGHSLEVKNYAIVGETIYDFSSGSRRKIALADLDLSATQKQNDERGLDFRLPTRPLGN